MLNTKLARLPRLLLAGLVALLVLAACSTSDPVTRLTLSADTVTLAPGETAEVTASLKTRAGADHLGPVVWASADEDVATVAAGTITAVSAGETVVTASFSNLKAEVAVTVTAAAEVEITGLSVTPGELALILGEVATGQLTAVFEYEDGSTGPATAVTWSSATPASATVSETGAVAAVAAGSTVVTASAAGFDASAKVTVFDPVTPEDPVTGLEVMPGLLELLAGSSIDIVAHFKHDSGSLRPAASATWASSDEGVVTVADGRLTAIAVGTADVTATAGTYTATVSVTVVEPVSPEDPINGLEVIPGAVELLTGGTVKVLARFTHESGITSPAADVTWTSNAESVATVAAGTITAVAAGTAQITAAASGQTTTVTVTVSAPPAPEDEINGIELNSTSLTIDVFEFDALQATFTHTSGATSPAVSASWSSSDEAVVIASAPGILQATGLGTADITVSSGDFSVTATITVVDPVVGLAIKPALSISIGAGDTITLSASTVTRTGVETDVTALTNWSSSDSAIADFTGNVVNANASGVAEITAEYDGLTAVARVSVSSLAHVFVGNAPDQPAGPLGNQLNPFPNISAALAHVNDDATITLLADWDGIEDAPLELVSHTLIGAGIDESVISLSNTASGCFVISLGSGASISDLSIDGTNVSDRSDCSGAGPRGVSVIGATDVSISRVHVYDETQVTETSATGRAFVGIHLYDADAALSDVRVSDTTRDAIQVNGGDVLVSGALITNAAQFQPGYGGIAAYANAGAGATKLTVAGDISFIGMSDNAGFILSSENGQPLEFLAGDVHLADDETRFPIAVWRGLDDITVVENDIKNLGVTFYAFGAPDSAASTLTHNGFVVGVASDQVQDAVNIALSYKDDTKDIGPRPLVAGVDLSNPTIYVGQTAEDNSMVLQHAINFAPAGSTIRVEPGVYSVAGSAHTYANINKPLTLVGPNAGIPGYDATRGPEAELVQDGDANSYKYGLRITSNNVVLDGFSLRVVNPVPAETAQTTPSWIGVFGINVSAAVTANVRVANTQVIDANYPLWVHRGTNTEIATDIVFENNLVEGPTVASDQGIIFQGATGSILNNVIRDTRGGIQVQPYNQPGSGTVAGNELEVFQYGIWLNSVWNETSAWQFHSNTILGVSSPVAWEGAGTDPDDFSGMRVEGMQAGAVGFTANNVNTGTTSAPGTQYLFRQKGTTGGHIANLGTPALLGALFTDNEFPQFDGSINIDNLDIDNGLIQLVVPVP